MPERLHFLDLGDHDLMFLRLVEGIFGRDNNNSNSY